MSEVVLSEQVQKAKLLADSSILPDSYRRQPSNLLWAMELADALDVSLAQAITGITVIQGKPTMSAEMMRALVLRAGHRFTVTDMTDQAVTVTVARKEWPDDVQQFTFTMADAQHAGLAGSATYKKPPKAMLLARATSMACRAVVPDVVSGMGYTPDEIGHDDPVKRVDTARLTPKAAPKTTVEVVETVAETAEVDVETGEILAETEPETEPEPGLLEAEIVDEPQTEDEPITPAQSRKLFASLRALDIADKEHGLKMIRDVVARDLASTKELTKAEASMVIDTLDEMAQQ